MMRVVLDTNVVVSALIWGGTPFRLIQAATAGEIELYTSPVLLEELREVLARGHLAAKLVEQRSSVEAAIGLYGELAIRVSPLATPRTVPGDADDDHVVAVAVAARADLIVSGDKAHLIPLGSVEGISIVSSAQAVGLVSSG
jgi:putative PIN family toxin of toxin-antitoxin system